MAVNGGRTYTALVAGGAHTCSLALGGTSFCWGYIGYGHLGDGTSGVNGDTSANRTIPVAVIRRALGGPRAVACGGGIPLV